MATGCMTLEPLLCDHRLLIIMAETIDRSGIERNANGSEEPHSADPELWNFDGTEVDLAEGHKYDGYAAVTWRSSADGCIPWLPR